MEQLLYGFILFYLFYFLKPIQQLLLGEKFIHSKGRTNDGRHFFMPVERMIMK